MLTMVDFVIVVRTGKEGRAKDYYTLECLAFLIKNRDLQHSMYVKNAGVSEYFDKCEWVYRTLN